MGVFKVSETTTTILLILCFSLGYWKPNTSLNHAHMTGDARGLHVISGNSQLMIWLLISKFWIKFYFVFNYLKKINEILIQKLILTTYFFLYKIYFSLPFTMQQPENFLIFLFQKLFLKSFNIFWISIFESQLEFL